MVAKAYTRTYLSSECAEKRGLAAARRPHDGKQSPGLCLATHAIQEPFFAVAHRKRHVLRMYAYTANGILTEGGRTDE